MPQSESFWNELHVFAQQHNQFGLLLIIALIIAASLGAGVLKTARPLPPLCCFS